MVSISPTATPIAIGADFLSGRKVGGFAIRDLKTKTTHTTFIIHILFDFKYEIELILLDLV